MWWMFNSLLLNYVLITSLVCSGVHTLLILSPPQLAGFVDVSFNVTL